jgi:hypothetical protein
LDTGSAGGVAGTLREEIHRHEEDKRMPYLSSIERLALEKGLREGEATGLRKGLLQGIEWTLTTKFGPAGRKLLGRIRRIEQVETLRRIGRAIKKAKRLDDVQAYLKKKRQQGEEQKGNQEERR